MKDGLVLSNDLTLPVDVATQKLAFMGRTGSGKSYGASKLAELMIIAGVQVIVIDVVGIWYGLRLAADGKGNGLAVPVFGGLHGDLPLEVSAGAFMADLIVDKGISVVLDVSQFTDPELNHFLLDFGTRLFQRRKASPSATHLFIEECQEVVPQNPQKGEERKLHAYGRICKIGRNFGIGVSLISQRPQEVNKKALNMTECLIVFQMVAPQERDAIRKWVEEKGLDLDIMSVLPKLEVGNAHVFSPVWLKVSKTVKIAKKTTFDASATPKVGQTLKPAEKLSPIDLEDIRTAMAATVERAKASDPKELQQRIADLEKQLKAKSSLVAPIGSNTRVEKVIEKVKVPVLSEQKLQSIVEAIYKLQETAKERSEKTENEFQKVVSKVMEAITKLKVVDTVPIRPATLLPSAPRVARRPVIHNPEILSSDKAITPSQQKILNSLSWWESVGDTQPDKMVVAVVAGYTVGGHFMNMLGGLRSLGLIDYPQPSLVSLTEAGASLAAPVTKHLSLEEFHEFWRSKLTPSLWRILESVIQNHPNLMTKEELAAASGYTVAGHFMNMLGHLRSLGVITKRGDIAATIKLFPPHLAGMKAAKYE